VRPSGSPPPFSCQLLLAGQELAQRGARLDRLPARPAQDAARAGPASPDFETLSRPAVIPVLALPS
jgi:hypothetical protein